MKSEGNGTGIHQGNGTGIESDGTGISQGNGTGIHQGNGTGIESNGTGVSQGNGTGIKRWSGLLMSLAFMLVTVTAFAAHTPQYRSGTLLMVVNDDSGSISWHVDGLLFTGTGSIVNGEFYSLLDAPGVNHVGDGTGVNHVGDGTGVNHVGDGTGVNHVGDGTGVSYVGDGSGYSVSNDGNGLFIESYISENDDAGLTPINASIGETSRAGEGLDMSAVYKSFAVVAAVNAGQSKGALYGITYNDIAVEISAVNIITRHQKAGRAR